MPKSSHQAATEVARLDLPAPGGYSIIRSEGPDGLPQFRVVNPMGVLEVALPTMRLARLHLGLPVPTEPRPLPASCPPPAATEIAADIDDRIRALMAQGLSRPEIVTAVHSEFRLTRYASRLACDRCGVPCRVSPQSRLAQRRNRAAELVASGYSDKDGTARLGVELRLPRATAAAAMWWARTQAA